MTIQEAYNTVLLSINKLHELGVVVTTTKSVFAEKEQEKNYYLLTYGKPWCLDAMAKPRLTH